MSSDKKAAFFELVHHPVEASFTLQNMWISSGLSALRASQARISANTFADQVEDLFEQDYQLEQQYHQLLDGTSHVDCLMIVSHNIELTRSVGKWDHMMDQTHLM